MLHLIEHKNNLWAMNGLFRNAYNSVIYKITSTNTWELEAWQGNATFAFYFLQSGEKGGQV